MQTEPAWWACDRWAHASLGMERSARPFSLDRNASTVSLSPMGLKSLLCYQQSEDDSCGAAALMVALAELLELPDSTLNTKNEMEIWGRIQATGPYPASLPGKMAILAEDQGAVAALYEDSERLAEAKSQLEQQASFDVRDLLEQHYKARADARQCGIQTESVSASQLSGKLTGGWLLLAFAIPMTNATKITLHWRLYRRGNGQIWEMDSCEGTNQDLSPSEFDDLLGRCEFPPVAIGLAVALSRRDQPVVPDRGFKAR